jgi:LDH2 family malate/lactate/ureidoglycolate dehydrogenase
MPTIASELLHAITAEIFRACGTPDDLADQVAGSLVNANLAGHDSHGVIRVPGYVKMIQERQLDPVARPEVIRETPGSALVDGKWAFGQVSIRNATEVVIRKAKATQAAVVAVVRCNHIGRLGEWTSLAAASDVIALVLAGGFGPWHAIAAPFGGATGVFSTNPLSFGVPGGKATPDVVVDFATTVVAEGKVHVAQAKGAALPPGSLLDRDGNPSTDPDDLSAGGVLLPFGGHKGYGLATVVELLGGAFSPNRAYNPDLPGCAVLVGLDATTFQSLDEYEESTDYYLGRIKEVPPAPGFSEVLWPGEPEQRSRQQRLREGIPIPDTTWEALQSLISGQFSETGGRDG